MTNQVVVLGPQNERTASLLERYQMLSRRNGEMVDFKHVDSALPVEEVASQAADAIALIPAGVRVFTTDLIHRLPNLRLIQTTSAGTDWIEKPAVYELGVKVANNGGGNRVAVSEHTITLMVGVYRKLDHQIRSAKEGKWSSDLPGQPEDFHTLEEKTVGIIGFGRIGQAVAKRLQGWDCEIVYSDIVDIPRETEERLNATRMETDELLATSDVVTLHVPLEPSTYHMIGARELRLMKPTAILINACRGPVVDEGPLTEALREGVIAGAGLDVLEQEPTPTDNPLLQMEHVIVTPHTASRAIESMLTSTEFAVANVSRVARGEEPESIVLPV